MVINKQYFDYILLFFCLFSTQRPLVFLGGPPKTIAPKETLSSVLVEPQNSISATAPTLSAFSPWAHGPSRCLLSVALGSRSDTNGPHAQGGDIVPGPFRETRNCVSPSV